MGRDVGCTVGRSSVVYLDLDRSILRGLYAVTPDAADVADTPQLLARVADALRGGCRLVQYRNKSAAAGLRRQQATELRRLCHDAGARLIINDHLDLALDIGADGLHLGGEDGDLPAARAALGPGRMLGVSCYNRLEAADAAVAAGADYIAFGAIYTSTVKPQAVAASLDLLRAARRRFPDLPIAAIGGITRANAAPVIAAGADLLAVITDLFAADDTLTIADRALAYQELFHHDHAHLA